MFFCVKLRKVLFLLIVIIIIFSAVKMSDIIPTISTPVTSKVVIIDAGHGGFDPGAISSNGTLEKDINIKIAVKLQELFEKSGTFTIMTRVSDDELGSSKKEDMRARKEIWKSIYIDTLK